MDRSNAATVAKLVLGIALGLLACACSNLDCDVGAGPGSGAGSCRAHTTFFAAQTHVAHAVDFTKS